MSTRLDRKGASTRLIEAYVYAGPRLLGLAPVLRPTARAGGAVMEVSLASICGTDVRTHRFGNDGLKPPRVIGHEGCGVIREVGSGVEGFKQGDRILVVPAIGCGSCRSCRRGHTNMCENLKTLGFEYDGLFAKYMEIPPEAFAMGNVIPIPPSVTDVEASLVEPAACCLNGQGFLRIGLEDTVLIFGAGFIGCVHAVLAMKSGCARVIIADVSQKRMSHVATLLPQVEFLNSSSPEFTGALLNKTEGRGADVIVTACAAGETHRAAMEISARRARISLFGGLSGDAWGFLNSNSIHYKELSVFGSHASTAEENGRILDMVSKKEIDIAKFASGVHPLSKIESAFEELKKENVLKVLISP